MFSHHLGSGLQHTKKVINGKEYDVVEDYDLNPTIVKLNHIGVYLYTYTIPHCDYEFHLTEFTGTIL